MLSTANHSTPNLSPGGGDRASWHSFRSAHPVGSAMAPGTYVLVVGGLLLALGVALGAVGHQLLALIG